MFRLMPGLTWTTHAHDDTGMRGRDATQACQSLNERILAMKALGAVRQKKLVHIKYVTSIFPSTAMISRPAYYARVHIVCEILWYTYCTGNCSKTIFCRIIENRQKNAANGGYKSLSGITFRHSCQSTCKQRQKVTTCKSHSIRSRLLSSCLSTASPLRSLSIKSRTPLIVRD